jgi:hypothetical protein
MLAQIHEGSESSSTKPQTGELIASGQVARENGGFGIKFGRCVTVVLLAVLMAATIPFFVVVQRVC